jgi:hypothetical protein
MRTIGRLPIAFVFIVGCQSPSTPTRPKQVSIAELGRETDHLVFFSYVGSDTEFHYFTTAEGKDFRVPFAEWTTAGAFARGTGMNLFVTVKDCKITVPDPTAMAALSEDEILHRPYKKPPP